MARHTRKEKAIQEVVKLIKEMDSNALLFSEVGMSSATQKIRLELFDILTVNGYEITQDYTIVIK